MLKAYTPAFFSNLVYTDPSKQIIPEGWVLLLSSEHDVFNRDFLSCVYVNTNLHQVIIAIRGTVPTKSWNLWEDFLIALNLVPTVYEYDAKPFLDLAVKTINFIPNIKEYSITITGHSLGATLAEIASANYAIKAVTFESPGSELIVSVMVSKGLLPEDSLIYLKNNLIIFNSAPNAIDSINSHLCKSLIRLYPELDFNTASCIPNVINFFVDFTLQQHSIKPILDQFNPQTEEPLVYSIYETSKWPVGLSQSEARWKNYNLNPYYWDNAIVELYPICNSLGLSFGEFKKAFIGGLNHNPDPYNQIGDTVYYQSYPYYALLWGTTSGVDTLILKTGLNTIIHAYGFNIYNAVKVSPQGTGTYTVVQYDLDTNYKAKLFYEGVEVNKSVTNFYDNNWSTFKIGTAKYMLRRSPNEKGTYTMMICKTQESSCNNYFATFKFENSPAGQFGWISTYLIYYSWVNGEVLEKYAASINSEGVFGVAYGLVRSTNYHKFIQKYNVMSKEIISNYELNFGDKVYGPNFLDKNSRLWGNLFWIALVDKENCMFRDGTVDATEVINCEMSCTNNLPPFMQITINSDGQVISKTCSYSFNVYPPNWIVSLGSGYSYKYSAKDFNKAGIGCISSSDACEFPLSLGDGYYGPGATIGGNLYFPIRVPKSAYPYKVVFSETSLLGKIFGTGSNLEMHILTTLNSLKLNSTNALTLLNQKNNTDQILLYADPNPFPCANGNTCFRMLAFDYSGVIGQITFYNTVFLCRSQNRLQSNIVNATGIFHGLKVNLTNDDLSTCVQMIPQSYLEKMLSSTAKAARQGLVTGITNVLGDGLEKTGMKSYKANGVRYVLYYGALFMFKCGDYYSASGNNYDVTPTTTWQRTTQAVSAAVLDVGTLLLTNVVLGGTSRLLKFAGEKCTKKGWNLAGKALTFMGSLCQYGSYGYNAYQEGPAQTVINVAAGTVTQKLVEIPGNLAIDAFLKRHKQTLSGKNNVNYSTFNNSDIQLQDNLNLETETIEKNNKWF